MADKATDHLSNVKYQLPSAHATQQKLVPRKYPTCRPMCTKLIYYLNIT